ncbi:MAG: DNA methyltransferase, partial [Phycisphaerales bacterium]|nr:DNA methyltransferase [Phycisphaerales bacterium]
SNMQTHNASSTTPAAGNGRSSTSPPPPPAPKPDARVKLTAAQKREVINRVEAGQSQTQVAADFGVSQKQVSNIVRDHRKKVAEKEAAANKAATAAREMKDVGDLNVKNGAFQEVSKEIADASVDLIFTDPPYDRKTLPLYGEMAEVAARVLKPGGSLICYLGQYQIGEVIKLVEPHLRLWWTLCCLHTGTSARMTEYGVIVKWKPMLWFVKGTRGDKETFVEDLVESSQEKSHHDWQQSLVEAEYYISKLTKKNELVFDPFCGGGTTAVAAKKLNRRWLTCDIDADTVAIARKRVKNAD